MAAVLQCISDANDFENPSDSDDNISKVATNLGYLSIQLYQHELPTKPPALHQKPDEHEQHSPECMIEVKTTSILKLGKMRSNLFCYGLCKRGPA